jgi:SAM-dependent methyltransferase
VLEIDMYQESIGINNGLRIWYQCSSCGLYYQENLLTDRDLENIYAKYRNQSMRGKTVAQEFERIKHLPDSENNARINQLIHDRVLDAKKTLLDIGSGLGVFPYQVQCYLNKVYSIEPNKDSSDFINSLGIECYQGNYKPGVFNRKFDIVSIIHVLEHTRDPVGFLKNIAGELEEDGIVYIEVPDAIEFEYLNRDHDEFCSCHLWMFDVSTLDMICRKAGLNPYLIRRIKYGERNLSRITLLAKRR